MWSVRFTCVPTAGIGLGQSYRLHALRYSVRLVGHVGAVIFAWNPPGLWGKSVRGRSRCFYLLFLEFLDFLVARRGARSRARCGAAAIRGARREITAARCSAAWNRSDRMQDQVRARTGARGDAMDHNPGAAPPEDFRCPISLEIMAEPVILWTGQTYDRQSIQRWLDAGHTTCPKTKQELHDDTRLIPNYALRSLIQSWAAANSIELSAANSSGSGFRSKTSAGDSSGNHSSGNASKEAVEALVQGIRLGNPASAIRDSVRELRILAKESKLQRARICEAGVVAKLLDLLLDRKSPKPGAAALDLHELQPEIEENAVVALLNLSADDENKVGLVAEGVVEAILHILSRQRSSIDTKASAALAITSLAMVDVNKAIIGRHPGAMPALARLLGSASPRGTKDAAIALYSLCMLPENRHRAVSAGAVSVLLAGPGPVEGEAVLALLDVLATCAEGRAEMRARHGVVPSLVKTMAAESPATARAKESCAAVLAAVCGEDATWAAIARRAGGLNGARDMARRSSAGCRAARKAAALVRILSM